MDGYWFHLNIEHEVAGPYNLDIEAIACEQRQPEKRKGLHLIQAAVGAVAWAARC